MKVLLSIKPKFAEQIFTGRKRYEYRKVIFKKKNVRKIIVYASSPIQKVIGEFEIEKVLFDETNNLWEKTKNYAGISKRYFEEYFANKYMGYAIKVKNFHKYKKNISLEDSFNIAPPQSFAYVK